MIFCNSQYLNIKQWLDQLNSVGVTDFEKDERNLLMVDVSFTRARLFQSLHKNLQKMFPKDLLDCELVADEKSFEIFLKIKKTTLEIRKK